MKNHPFLLFTCCILIGLPVTISAQQHIIDSLTSTLGQNNMTIHQRGMTMARLADALSYSDLHLGLEKNSEALVYAEKNKDEAAASYAYSCRAVLYVVTGNTAAAQNAVDSAILLAKAAPSFIKGIAWFRKGYVENIKNNPDEALKSWQKALNYLNVEGGAPLPVQHLLFAIWYLCGKKRQRQGNKVRHAFLEERGEKS